MTELKLNQSALEVLSAFDSPDEIANYFRKIGITGERFSAWSCPVAVYIGVPCTTDDAYPEGKLGGKTIPFNHTISEFILQFDKKKYPDLIKQREPVLEDCEKEE